MKLAIWFLLLSTFLGCKNQLTTLQESHLSFYVGSYTRTEGHVDGKAKGIGYIEINPHKGNILFEKNIASIVNPSFLTTTKNKEYLYSVSQLARPHEETGYVYAYKMIAKDSLEKIGQYPSNAPGPCHILLDHSEKMLFVSNYQGGIVTVFNRKNDGTLVENKTLEFKGNSILIRQKSPHLHSAQISPDNSRLLIADLGSDKIWIYQLDVPNQSLIPLKKQPFLKLMPGAGPRHLAFKSDNELFVINELNNTLCGIVRENDRYKVVSTASTLPSGFKDKNTSADVRVHPGGQFVYGSNRGHNSIVAFSIGPDASLTLISHYPSLGETPRNINISQDGKWLIAANQDSHNLAVYSINNLSGELTLSAEIEKIYTPVCIEF
jgi:6-phosphogluconolactonase